MDVNKNLAIDNFNGYYQFLNNDYPTWVMLDRINYPSVTTAYQASRTNDQNIRKQILEAEDYQTLSKIAMRIKNPHNWYSRRYKIMEKLVRDKFRRNKDIAARLLATKDRILTNKYPTNGDNEQYWGIIPNGNGSNNLGKILMAIRQQIKKGIDHQKWIQQQNLQTDKLMYPTLSLLVEKDNKKIDKLFLQNKNIFYFGNLKDNDYKLEHPSISKFHACIYFDNQSKVMLVDLNSSHGTYLNSVKIAILQPICLNNGDAIVFGMSSRKYIVEIDRTKVQQELARKQKQLQSQIKNLQALKNTNTMTSQEIKNKIGYNLNCCVLVENIPKGTNYRDLKELFEDYGKINQVRMCVDRKTGQQESTAILYFSSHKDAQNLVLKRVKHNLKENILEIKLIDQYQAEQIINKYQIQKRDQKNYRSDSPYRSRDKKDHRKSKY